MTNKDDPIYKALDDLYNRGRADQQKNFAQYDPRGTKEWQTVLALFRKKETL